MIVSLAGCKDDDRRCYHFLPVLAAHARVLPGDERVPAGDPLPQHPPDLHRHLLAGHEQLHVQPHHLLLDERQVSTKQRLSRNI